MKARNLVFLTVLVFLLAGSLNAVPYTCLGYMKVPTGYVLPHLMGEISIVGYAGPGVQEYDTVKNSSGVDIPVSKDADMQFTYSAAINYGFFDRVDLGLVYAGVGDGMFYANMKAQLIYESETMPAVAVGVDNMFSEFKDSYRDDDSEAYTDRLDFGYADPDDYTAWSPYIVLSKATILRGVSVFEQLETVITVGWGQNRFEGNKAISKRLGGMFGAVEFKPLPYLSVIGEMDGYNFNATLNFIYQNYEARVGLYRIEEYGQRDPKIALNLKYTLDAFSEVKAAGKNKRYSPTAEIVPDRRGTRVIRKSNESSTGENPLLEELEAIRAKRRQAEKELEEIRKVLEEE